MHHRRPRPERVELIIRPEDATFEANGVTATWDTSSGEIDAVFMRYLALVAELRNLRPGAKVSVRSSDIGTLAKCFEMSERAVKARIRQLQRDGGIQRIRDSLRGQVLLPAAGLMLALTGCGSLVLVQEPASHPSNTTGTAGAGVVAAQVAEVESQGAGSYEIADAIAVSRPAGHYEIADAIAVTRPGA